MYWTGVCAFRQARSVHKHEVAILELLSQASLTVLRAVNAGGERQGSHAPFCAPLHPRSADISLHCYSFPSLSPCTLVLCVTFVLLSLPLLSPTHLMPPLYPTATVPHRACDSPQLFLGEGKTPPLFCFVGPREESRGGR